MRSYLISYLYTITCCFDLFSFWSCFLDNINIVKKAETKSYNRINIAFKFFLWPWSEPRGNQPRPEFA